jgi:predicted ribosomally synthesized peptide with SipW-like signal peptide
MTARLRVAAILAICAFLVFAGTGVSYALWTARATATATIATGNIDVSLSGFNSLQYTFAPSSRAHVGEFTIHNTGTFGASYTAAFTVADPTSFAADVTVQAWVKPDAGSCATAAASTTGTWASMPPLTGTLDAGTSTTYCLSTSVSGPTAAHAGSVTPAVTVTSTLDGWNATAGPVQVTQNTKKGS